MPKRFRDAFHWKWPLYAGLVVCVVYLSIIFMDSGTSELIYWYAGFAVLVLCLLVAITFMFTGGWKTALSIVSAVVVSASCSLLLLLSEHDIRTAARWKVHSAEYKRELLSGAASAQSEYRYAYWDEWGWAGDALQYLVYDPNDSISAKNKMISMDGQPCKISQVHRFEKAWYLITCF